MHVAQMAHQRGGAAGPVAAQVARECALAEMHAAEVLGEVARLGAAVRAEVARVGPFFFVHGALVLVQVADGGKGDFALWVGRGRFTQGKKSE